MSGNRKVAAGMLVTREGLFGLPIADKLSRHILSGITEVFSKNPDCKTVRVDFSVTVEEENER